MMTLEQLPPKGVKREQAILELGKDEANGELLYQLDCGPSWSRANGWAAISCRMPVPTVYRSRLPQLF